MKRLHVLISIILGLILITLLFTACMVKVEMEGDYVAPDSIKMTMTASIAGEKSPTIELVKIGDAVYVKDPETQQWMTEKEVESYQEFTGIEDFALANIEFINAFEGSSLLSDEEINGVPCFHVKGTVDATKLEDSSKEVASMEMGILDAELWIGKKDYLVRQMLLKVQAGASTSTTELPMSGGSFSFIFKFSKYNEPITIDAPQINSG
jgi:hypothetical protein